MTCEHIQSAVVHYWRCSVCKHEWEIYGGDPFDYDSDEAPRGREPVWCPNCFTDRQIDRAPTHRDREYMRNRGIKGV